MDSIVEFLEELLLSAIPLFVAIDALGVLPIALGLLQHEKERERARALRYAVFTALGLGLGFIAIGKFVFAVLGILSADFLVAGGLILLILAVKDLVTGRMLESTAEEQLVGVVPLGTPLIVGPATLTTLLLLIDTYTLGAVLLAFLLNLVFAWIVFAQANRVVRFLGDSGLKVTAKIASLLLAAIAVKMIRQGVLEILGI